jgi:O-antigen/teichoic acid export membrane protein
MGSDQNQTYHKLASGTSLVLLGTFVSLGAAFSTRVFLAQKLGPDTYGVLVLGLSATMTVVTIAKAGLPRGVARNIPRAESSNRQRSIALTGLVLTAGLGIGMGVLLAISSPLLADQVFNEGRLACVLLVFAFFIPISTIQGMAVSTFRGYVRAKERVLVQNLFLPLSRLFFVILAVSLGYGLLGTTVAWVASGVLTVGLALLLLYRRLDVIRFEPFEGQYKPLIGFSLPLLLSASMWNLIQQMDNLLIGFHLTTDAVGTYDAAYSLSKLIITALGAFSFLFMPIFSELHAGGEIAEMDRLYKTATKWVSGLTLPVYLLLMLYPEVVLATLFGPKYGSGAQSLRIIVTGFFIHAVSGLAGNALVSLGRTRVIMVVNAAVAVVNIGLNYTLIPVFGIVGAAIASALSYGILNVSYLITLRGYGVSPVSKALVTPIVLTSSITTVVGWLIFSAISIEFWMIPIGVVLVSMLHVVIYVFFGGLEPADINIINAAEEMFGLDLTRIRSFLSEYV